MFYDSRPCRDGERPNAREVLLTWARARGYKNLAIRYLKLADSASDCNVRDRFILIARHYGTLADTERRVADGMSNRHSQSVADQSFSFTLVLLLLMSVAFTTFPFSSANAGDCLAAPNGPASQGKRWYYHLNRATQQKCWYVRTPGAQAQQAATPQTASGDGAPISIGPSPTTPSATHAIVQSPRARTSPVKPAPAPIPNAAQDEAVSRSAAVEITAGASEAASQESSSSETSGQAAGLPPPVWPDPPTTAAVVRVQEASAATADVRVNMVSDDGAAGSGEQANSFHVPIIVFPALALGLVVMGIGSRIIVEMLLFITCG
jgi:hypothetical protein